MNVPITVITIYNLFVLFSGRFTVQPRSRFLIYLGALLPLLDYILRFALGEVWFQTRGYIFHSFIYQGLFWGIAAILHWSFFGNVRRAFQTLLPLVGLVLYFILSLFSNECLLFFRPISDIHFCLKLMSSGFLIPLVISLVFLISRRWSDVSTKFASRVSLGVLTGLIIYSGFVRIQVANRISDRIDPSTVVSMTSVNQAKTLWYIVSQNEGEYNGAEYHVFQGWQDDITRKQLYKRQSDTQVALSDPVVRRIYLNSFKNPVIEVERLNEYWDITISEFVPLRELLWTKKAVLRKNRSGQIVSFSIGYGSII